MRPQPVPLLLHYARRDPMVPPRFAHVDAVERLLPPVLDFLGAR